MQAYVQLVLVLLGAYLVGSFPTAYVTARVVRGIDLRRYGSGNVGGSNVSLFVGKKALVGVGLADLLKGCLPVIVAGQLGLGVEAQALAGLGAVAGHNWSLYLGFTGGRGVGTAVGTLLGMGLLGPVGVFVAISLAGVVLRSVPLWMGLAVASLPLTGIALRQSPEVVLFCTGLVGLLGLKRLVANGETLSPGLPRWQVLRNRLLYDRDIRDRDAWVHRSPPPSNA